MGGTDPECNHQYQKGGRNPETSSKQLTSAGTTFSQYEKVCKRCGALRIDDQIGLEETPEIYVARLVEVFREVRRVLADDGTLWLNLGDSYASGWAVNRGTRSTIGADAPPLSQRVNRLTGDLKEKDLIGVPWMVAFALRADGWYLRSDIIWHKPNPMPESVTDRPTKSHEYIFLLSKSAQYYYDYEAILEPASTNSHGGTKPNPGPKAMVTGNHGGSLGLTPAQRMKNLQPDGQQPNSMHLRRAEGLPDTEYPARNKRSVWTVNNSLADFIAYALERGVDIQQLVDEFVDNPNKRDVWNVSTKPYSGAHFATFPPDLIEPCILAGSRPGDWVLDPFGGSGTTLAVAIKHHRNGIACELNPAYIDLMNKRLSNVQPVLFAASVQP